MKASLLNGVILGFGFVGLVASGATYSRKTIHLSAPGIIGGIPVQAGDVEVFDPGEELAHGVLAQDFPLQGLALPAGSELTMESPGHLADTKLPVGAVHWIVGSPFPSEGELKFGYTQYWEQLRGLLASNPAQYPAFPTGDLSKDIFQNDVTAACRRSRLFKPPQEPRPWFCTYEVTAQTALEQKFGTETVTIPAGTVVSFGKWGITTLRLSHDQMFNGLPVSAEKDIRVNRWSQSGSQSIVGLYLSQDAEYLGISISAIQEVEFYDADAKGVANLSAFAPLGPLTLRGDGQEITVAPLQRLYLNRDGSLHYGKLASPQNVQGILFPEDSLIFLGDKDGTPIGSVGLPPRGSVIIDGVTYGPAAVGSALFLDFDETGRVVRVRQ